MKKKLGLTNYDVTLVNGLPLIHIELKKGCGHKEAFNQITAIKGIPSGPPMDFLNMSNFLLYPTGLILSIILIQQEMPM